MEQKRIWDLITRELSGAASEMEFQELQELLRDNPDICYSLQILYNIRKRADQGNDKTEKAYARLIQRIEEYGF